jgi:hypothetical protein
MTDDDKLSIVGRVGNEEVEVELVTREEREISEAVERFIERAFERLLWARVLSPSAPTEPRSARAHRQRFCR